MTFRQLATSAAFAFVVMSACLASAHPQTGWNRFRGPNGSGLDSSQPLPEKLSSENTLWKQKLAGTGHSSPIVSGDRVLVTAWDGSGQLWMQDFSLQDGTAGWTWKSPLQPAPMHRLNSPAASTPATDGRRAFVLACESGHLLLFAIGLDKGETLWTRDFGEWKAQHGFAASPVVVDDLVVFVNSQENPDNSPGPAGVMIAVRADTGADAWQRKLLPGKAAYAVPLVVPSTGGDSVIVNSSSSDGIYATRARDGAALWNSTALPERTVGSSILMGERVLASCGSGGGGRLMIGVDLPVPERNNAAPSGEAPETVSERNVPVVSPALELHKNLCYVPTPIAVDGRLYLFADNGVVSCVDPGNGEYHWREKLCQGWWGSPVSDGRRIYSVDKDGVVHVIIAGETFSGDSSFPLGEASSATPALSGGRLVLRTESQLWCFGEK